MTRNSGLFDLPLALTDSWNASTASKTANWTYSRLAKDIIGEPAGDLVHLCDVLKDLTMYGYASNYFHQVLNILHTVTDPVSAGIV